MEKNEVFLSKGDGMLDAGCLTKCKNAVCMIYCNTNENIKRGSGFFASMKIKGVEHNVIVTNNHVIKSCDDAQNAVVRFHFEGHLPGADAVLYPDKLFYTNEILDYTIIGCDSDIIENNLCLNPIEFEPESELNVGDDIFIFQHPKGESKKFSYQTISKIDRPFVYYNADTDIGSSGSCVLRKFKLIAVHSKGSDVLKYNKGTLCSEILSHVNSGKNTIPKPLLESAFNTKHKLKDNSDLVSADTKRVCLDNESKKCSSVKETERAELTENLLEKISKDIVGYWKHLGRRLKLSSREIECIQRDHVNYDDIAEKAFAMLRAWKESSPNNQNLQEILKKALMEYGKVETAFKYFSN